MEDVKLNRDMQMLAEVIGEELTVKIMKELGGMSLYVSRYRDDNVIFKYYNDHGCDKKLTALRFNVSVRTVYRIVKHMQFQEQQLNMFEDNSHKIKKYGKQHNRGCLQPQ